MNRGAAEEPEPSRWRMATRAVAAGRDTAPGASLNVPLTLASTYRDGGTLGYGRDGNPTWSAFEQTLGALEGGHAVAFSSGLAAVSAVVERLPAAAVVTVPHDAYAGTRMLLRDLEGVGRVRLRLVDVTDTEAVLAALPDTHLMWLESPTNPMLGVADLPVVLGAAREAGVQTVVDNTFATPLLQQPLTWGATAVVHSATKYLGGHSDLLLGVVVTTDAGLRDALVTARAHHGATPGVMEAYLALRGLRTLPVRFARQQESAVVLARRLADHPGVRRVRYPGLPDDPGHERARAHMGGFGAVVAFEVEDAATAQRTTSRLRLVVPTTSLGGVETTVDHRRRWPGEERVPAGLLRLSVGLEDVADIWDDLAQALDGSKCT